ncbi:MAG: hypothetical protein ACT4P4_27300 [Betaproteobacteria bacterium]
MRRSQLFLLLGGIFCAASAVAAPRAQSAMECGIAADMAVVAHSLAAEQVQQPQASAIMARIYDVSGSERGKEMMKDIIAAAYVKSDSAAAGGSASQKFAEELFATCLKTGGNLDTVLGKKL